MKSQKIRLKIKMKWAENEMKWAESKDEIA